MTYRETLEYLYSRLPAFTRIGKAAYKADLNNITALSEALGNPHQKFRSVHIAGTNGKGSCSHYLASVFQEAGYKTGLFTSPHLKDFRERIRINGRCISQKKVIAFCEQHRGIFEELKPSFFEMTVALAFQHFASEKVDIAIIETGLGGRLDSTNIMQPECSLITNISFDHTDLLGDTLEKIAVEKAGIIKPGVPVIISETDSISGEIFKKKAAEEKAEIYFADQLTEIESPKQIFRTERLLLTGIASVQTDSKNKNSAKLEIESPLPGMYQLKNLKGVLVTCEVLQRAGWKIGTTAIERGINRVVENTRLHGRWELRSTNPAVIFDTGHNVAGVQEVLEQLKLQKFEHLHIVWGMASDKDISKVLAILPKEAKYYFCKANLPRALDAEDLKNQAAAMGLQGTAWGSVKKAFAAAKKAAGKADLVLVGGSTFVVAELV